MIRRRRSTIIIIRTINILITLTIMIIIIIIVCSSVTTGTPSARASGGEPNYTQSPFNLKGWNSHVHRELPIHFESTNLSRDNLSREIWAQRVQPYTQSP